MNLHVTTSDITTKYAGIDLNNQEAAMTELLKLSKQQLAEQLLQAKAHRSGTVQELAKAILQDEDLVAASYETIADAIKEMMPSAKTSSKSIASYVSKKREEWELPDRIRVSSARPKKEVEETEPEAAE